MSSSLGGLGLPVHCPYNTCDHPEYTAACESRLTQIRDMLDKAITEKPCEVDLKKCQAAKDAMMALSNSLLNIITHMYGGQSLEDIS